jgi:phenolic acid decarboxylase
MLYFLIEPQMSKIIYQVNSGGNNEEIIGDALYKLLKK